MRLPLERLFQDPPLTGPRLSGVVWKPDDSGLTHLKPSAVKDRPDLWSYRAADGAEALLITGDSLFVEGEPVPLEGYRWLPDGERLLLASKGRSWLLSVPSGALTPLAEEIDPDVAPELSPDENRLAFVRGGNLWVRELASGAERQLTADGSDVVLNGKLDWVYWEELGHRRSWRAFEWSPDGASLAFLRLDQSGVPQYPLVDVMEVHPTVTWQRYPKAGDPNSVVSLHVVSAADGRQLSQTEPSDRSYLAPGFVWTPDGRGVAYTRLARDQRTLELRLLQPEAGADDLLLTESDPHWLNAIGPARFLPDGTFLWRSERSGFAHVYRYSANGECLHAVTSGEWQVDAVHTVVDGWVYLSGSGEDPRDRLLYRAPLEGGETEILTSEGSWHEVDVQPRGEWVLVTSQATDRPPTTRLLRGDGVLQAVVQEPDPGWDAYEWPEAISVRFPAPTLPGESGDSPTLHGRLLLPSDFDRTRRYPVVVHVYGGPQAQTVRKTWVGDDPLELLLSQAGVLVWRLDNRGSWGRGHAFEAPVDRRMGEVELRDQLAGVEYLKSLPYVDPERIGITGWSYGGYLTLYAMLHSPEVWRCGVAGAPVTDWRLYDTIYTERYMGTPEENPDAYRTSSPVHAAEHLQAPLLLVHGTDDDNVHLQNTLQFVEALSRHRKPYELLAQPRQKHGFRGESARTYQHERMVEFLVRNL